MSAKGEPLHPFDQADFDETSLRLYRDVWVAKIPEMVNEFYQVIGSIDGLRNSLKRASIDRLKRMMADFLQTLIDPRRSGEQERMLEIGSVHFAWQIPMPWLSYTLHTYSSYLLREMTSNTDGSFMRLIFERLRWRDWWIMRGYEQAQAR